MVGFSRSGAPFGAHVDATAHTHGFARLPTRSGRSRRSWRRPHFQGIKRHTQRAKLIKLVNQTPDAIGQPWKRTSALFCSSAMYTHDRMFASVQELLSHSRFAFFVFPFSSAFTKDGSVVPISFRHTAGCISWSRLPFPMVHARRSHGTGEARRPRFVRLTRCVALVRKPADELSALKPDLILEKWFV